MFAPKGILSPSPLQAAGLSNGVNLVEPPARLQKEDKSDPFEEEKLESASGLRRETGPTKILSDK